MKNRYDIVAEAVEECMKECYKLAQPKVTWEDFKKDNKEYIDNKLDEKGIPAPYAFYYLPKEEFEAIKDAVAEAYGIEAAPIKLATSAAEAGQLAEEMDFPVVLKIASDKILHKSDIGGVKVGIQSKEEAEAVYEEIIANAKKAHPDIVPNGVEVQKMMDSGIEVLVGMIRDAQFGPMIAFGMGGVLVNLLEDVSFKLAKGMTSEEIAEQMEDTKVMGLLKGFRGEAPGDIDAVKSAIIRVARLTLDFPEISELDINPIFVYEKGSSALDIKIKLG